MIRTILKLRLCLAMLLIGPVSIVNCKKDDKESSSEKEKENTKSKDQSDEDDESPKKKKKKTQSDDEESPKKKSESDEDDSPKKKKSTDSDSFEKVGIKACDDYLEKMLQCYKSNKNLPKSAIETQKEALANVAKVWRNAIQSGGSLAKQGVEKGCQTALKTAKEAMKDQCKELSDDE